MPIEKPADFGGGVTAQIVGVAAVAGNGQGVGDLDAPAVQVRVKVANDTGEPLSMDSVVVNAYYGADDTPASPLLGDPSADWLRGQLADGRTATGVYLFTVPPDERDQVTITVSYRAGTPIAVFEGSVPTA